MRNEREIAGEHLLEGLRVHPRVDYQLLNDGPQLEQLATDVPTIVAFDGKSYHDVIAVLDWDHRLPSKAMHLRIYAYYSSGSFEAGKLAFEQRLAMIQSRDKFPEFDVPDFSGLPADEAYDGDVTLDGNVERLRLLSDWRRDISGKLTKLALKSVRSSEQFKKVVAETRGTRPNYLGDIEAVGWAPPCETHLEGWTIDVWYLVYLDQSVGKGRSFLVKPDKKSVIGVREFVVRAG